METLPTHVAVGNTYEMQEIDTSKRSPEQRQAFFDIITAEDFDFACSNPFTPEVPVDYMGPVMYIWYTTDGRLRFRRVGRSGKTLFDG